MQQLLSSVSEKDLTMIHLRQASILVVDDSSTMRSIVSGMLQHLGAVHIDTAASGEAALAKIMAVNFTLIISDWNMEPMNGLSLLRAVRPLQRPKLNRFIFMTTEHSYGHRASAKIDGADEFVVKPFNVSTLKEKIETVFNRA